MAILIWEELSNDEAGSLSDQFKYCGGHKLLEQVNKSLRRLNAQFKIVFECDQTFTRTIISAEQFHASVEPEQSKISGIVELALQDADGNKVYPDDVGVGISQAIPVIVAALLYPRIGVEQPELHLHPRLQMELADIFVNRVNALKKNRAWQRDFALIETHSEHMILRVMRRIRETTGGKKIGNLYRLNADDVQIIYATKNRGCTQYLILRIDSDGTLLDPWPNGFFAERYNELFSGHY